MMTMLEKLLLEWRNKKGIGSVIINDVDKELELLKEVLIKVTSKSPNNKILIVIDSFNDRYKINDIVKEIKINGRGQIFIFTKDYVNNLPLSYRYELVITFNITTITDRVKELLQIAKFKLCIFKERLNAAEDVTKLYNVAPMLDSIKDEDLRQLRYSTPVEEIQVGIDIPNTSEDYTLLQKYNEYIQQSIAMFGSLDVMNQCRTGNAALNISAYQLCLNIAQENGWSDHLDMTIPFNKELDNIYNPGSLKERANLTYDIIRKRQNLLSDYKGKIDEIKNIVEKHKDSKILIINKRGEFANEVTYELNVTHGMICGNFHDRVEPIPQVDVNGDVVLYKSGSNKGTPRYMKADAQKTYFNSLINNGVIRVLSTNNTPDEKLDLEPSVVIITSPMCKTLREYLYRLKGLKIGQIGQVLTLYTLYIKNSMEEKLLDNRELLPNQRVVKKCKNGDNLIDISDYVIDD